MTPDEWQKGMENEAASVEDRVWAGEARRVAQLQQGTRTLFLLTAATPIYILIGSLLVMALIAPSIGYGPQGLCLFILGSALPSFLTALLVPLLTTVFLIRLGLRPALVWIVPVLGMLLGMLAGEVLTLAVPMNFPGVIVGEPVDLLPQGSPDLTQNLLSLLLTASAVGLGIWLGHRQRSGRIQRA